MFRKCSFDECHSWQIYESIHRYFDPNANNTAHDIISSLDMVALYKFAKHNYKSLIEFTGAYLIADTTDFESIKVKRIYCVVCVGTITLYINEDYVVLNEGKLVEFYCDYQKYDVHTYTIIKNRLNDLENIIYEYICDDVTDPLHRELRRTYP